MKLQQITNFLAKTISQFCMVVFLVLFAAAAEGSLSIIAALVLGAVNLVVLNALCGVLLGHTTDEAAFVAKKQAPQTVYTVRRSTASVPLRLVHGNRVA